MKILLMVYLLNIASSSSLPSSFGNVSTIFNTFWSPKMTVTLSNSEGTRQRWFLFYKHLYFQKLGIKYLSQSIFFLICFDYIKNKSYINLGDGSQIRIVWSCSNAVKTHNVLYIPFKILSTRRPVAKTSIKYNNNLKETMKKRRNQLILSLLSK